MSNYYVDHGAYASALGATPTWGVPQEGDGSTKDAATASAVATFDFTPGIILNNETVTLCGVVFTAKTSGATGNQFNIGSADATMDNLAAAINACTTTVGATVAIGTPQLRNLVYARGPANSAPSNKCQIMMRVGSTALNHANNTNVAIAHACATAPTLTQFIGGTGGCWGWLVNIAAIGVSSSIALNTYGAIGTVLPMVVLASDASVQAQPTRFDIIYGRSSGTTLDFSSNTTWNWTNFTGPVTFLLDDGTIWSGSNAGLNITFAPTSSNANIVIGGAGKNFTFGAVKKGKLSIYPRSWTSSGRVYVVIGTSGAAPNTTIRNVTFTEAVGVPALAMVAIANYTGSVFVGCTVDWSNNVRSGATPTLISGDLVGYYAFIDCDIKANLTNAADPGAWIATSAITVNDGLIKFSGCRFSGWSSPLKLFTGLTNPRNANVVVENCTGIRIDSGTYLGFLSVIGGNDPYNGQFFYKSADVGGTWRSEKSNGICEWIYGSAQWPTLNAVKQDGTPWSIRLLWPGTSGQVNFVDPFEAPPLAQEYRQAAATKNIRTEFLVPTSLTLTEFLVEQSVTYIGTDDLPHTETTFGKASALTTSTAAWTLNSLTGYSKYKLTLTTANQIKQNTRVIVTIKFNLDCPNGSNTFLFLDPEFAIE